MVSVHSPSQHWRNLKNYESLWRDSDRHEGELVKELEEICLTVYLVERGQCLPWADQR